MLKKLRLPFILFGTALMLLGPTGAFARDHDHDDWRWRHERYEWREHHHRHHAHIRVYYGPQYRYGYYDRWGYWHPYR